jgi:hypothetical protein
VRADPGYYRYISRESQRCRSHHGGSSRAETKQAIETHVNDLEAKVVDQTTIVQKHVISATKDIMHQNTKEHVNTRDFMDTRFEQHTVAMRTQIKREGDYVRDQIERISRELNALITSFNAEKRPSKGDTKRFESEANAKVIALELNVITLEYIEVYLYQY